MENLLRDPMFGVQRADGSRVDLTLPEVMAALSHQEPLEFTALRPHQRHAWYAMLTQLGALACHNDGLGVQRSAQVWHLGLLGLTGNDEAPWDLVPRSEESPAFLQPPLAKPAKLRKEVIETPDAANLDTLVTGRLFEVQPGRVRHPRFDHWVYALTAVQTGCSYAGRSLYGVARMRHVYASRVCITRASSTRFGARFGRDVSLWLSERAELVRRYGLADKGGHSLLWLVPWGGSKGEDLDASALDPFVIEVARIIRLKKNESGRIVALDCPTNAPRISSEFRGLIGDLWGWHGAFDDDDDPALFALSERGWTSSIVAKLLFCKGAYAPALSSFGLRTDPSILHLEGVARGKGKTFGFHERDIPLPLEVGDALERDSERARLGTIAMEFLKIATEARLRVLRFGVIVLLGGGSAKSVDQKDKRIPALIASFDLEVDEEFFPCLWEALRVPEDVWRPKWSNTVLTIARGVFERAIKVSPFRDATRYSTEALARNAFEANSRLALPDAFARKEAVDEPK